LIFCINQPPVKDKLVFFFWQALFRCLKKRHQADSFLMTAQVGGRILSLAGEGRVGKTWEKGGF
jgi:hypothetical protein